MTETTLPPPGDRNETIEIIKTVAVALLIALFLRVLLFQPFTIPSASEEPNLYEGDYVIVTKFDYGWSRHSIPFSPPLFEGRILSKAPERGDIIVFKLPRDGRTDYIKRLIGVPGDRVQMRQGLLYLNGQPVERRQTELVTETGGSGLMRPVARVEETLPGGRRYMTNDFGADGDLDDTPEVVVPPGHYFFIGDNRDNSADSRLPTEIGVGLVPEENLVGKARLVLLSWSPGASLFKPWTWVLNLRPSRFGKVLH
ncbi:MAG: signal peptidase I [Phenylobacterium sp.]|jgi:signal peptidase I|uniref:signal peptidase I n=1 Tax=Phenylobacterium sp. TaxID=1871053 RepID=UPI0025E01AEA|nr:signal peptidase I [Phenylobacterium sp.]MCA3729407.1 signal peptidase I [Phenylobacterium sp.]MCA3733012.1 signal peptidase I [Phenylobacterium sp.]MCA3738853.1 signal peptidase I [Phenylobacterium sp.]MCA3754127.1 signal peptidase I [Phenylobacterium sp.]MCA3758706.1 signal peptidase I [Phenylobacterium sp.]